MSNLHQPEDLAKRHADLNELQALAVRFNAAMKNWIAKAPRNAKSADMVKLLTMGNNIAFAALASAWRSESDRAAAFALAAEIEERYFAKQAAAE